MITVDLPQPVQQHILFFLEKNHFPAVKEFSDKFIFHFNSQNALDLELLIFNNYHESILDFCMKSIC